MSAPENIEPKSMSKISIGIITIATGKYYEQFIPTLLQSLDRFIDKSEANLQVYCFTDATSRHPNLTHFAIPHLGWPFSTLLRYHWIASQLPILLRNDILVYMDADMQVVAPIDLTLWRPSLFDVEHPGYVGTTGAFEIDRQEACYLAPPLRQTYFQGCLWGGSRDSFSQLISELSTLVASNLAQGAIPTWHDESYLNFYLATHPCASLPISYAWPATMSQQGMQPVILHLEKPHSAIRQTSELVISLGEILKVDDLPAQLALYQRLYLVAHEKSQRLELQILHHNSLFVRLREWLSHYKRKIKL